MTAARRRPGAHRRPRSRAPQGVRRDHRRQGLDPPRGQEAAAPGGSRAGPSTPAGPDRVRVPRSPRGGRPRHGGPSAGRAHPDRRARGRRARRALRRAARRRRPWSATVYLGKVQNVLPSMEAAFVDVGRGRNAVLYAGEVNWDAAGLDGQPRRIEHAMKSGDSVLVQVTKDPIGHKGARLTAQVSLPGRYLVYVPDGSMTGISRKLPDTERSRLKSDPEEDRARRRRRHRAHRCRGRQRRRAAARRHTAGRAVGEPSPSRPRPPVRPRCFTRSQTSPSEWSATSSTKTSASSWSSAATRHGRPSRRTSQHVAPDLCQRLSQVDRHRRRVPRRTGSTSS